MSKSVIILGATGFIGRNMVDACVKSGKFSKIRAVDKVLPQTAFLGKPHDEAFAAPGVEFKQGNLTNTASITKVFDNDGGNFDVCINCAAETKLSQSNEVYQEKIVDMVTRCAKAALESGCKRWIELSTAQVYDSDKKAAKEDGKLKPWTSQAKFKLDAENALKEISGLQLTILRPACVYGPGDTSGVAPRIICGAVYKQLGEKMKFLWGKDQRFNTVHVDDVTACVLTCLEKESSIGKTYNLADSGDTTQGTISELLEPIFGIQTGFYGSMLSTAAKAKGMKDVCEQANDKHLEPWSELCKAQNILNTPLTPFIDQELLYNNNLAVDGTFVTKDLEGFSYKHPKLTGDGIKQSMDYFVNQGLFPKI